MKILLDENLPTDLRLEMAVHDVFTVAFLGWKGLGNGALLQRAAQEKFDALMTMDLGFGFQHDPSNLPLTVIILRAPSNALEQLRPLVPAILESLRTLQPQTLVRIGE